MVAPVYLKVFAANLHVYVVKGILVSDVKHQVRDLDKNYFPVDAYLDHLTTTTITPLNSCGICTIKPSVEFGDRIDNSQPVNTYVWPWIVSLQTRGSHFVSIHDHLSMLPTKIFLIFSVVVL
jgi:hypothetical protein